MYNDNSNKKQIDNIYKQIKQIIISVPHIKNCEPNANLLFDNLWLGNINAAHNLDFISDNNIKYIINAGYNIPNLFTFVNYTTLQIIDHEACYTNYIETMEKAASIINKAIIEKCPILVHCKRGHHRSASIIAFYLIKYRQMSLVNSVQFIKNIRPNAFRRINCMLKTLINYESSKFQSEFDTKFV